MTQEHRINLDKTIELYKSKVAFYESQNTRGEYAVTVRELKYVVETLEALRSERSQGEWGPCYKSYKNGLFYRDCSICGKATITGDWKFCPYCGAEMKGGIPTTDDKETENE